MTNKAKDVRKALDLTQHGAGELFTGQTGKNASDTWGRWERTGKWPAPAEKLLNLILLLKMAEENKKRNCHGALQLALKMLEPIDNQD